MPYKIRSFSTVEDLETWLNSSDELNAPEQDSGKGQGGNPHDQPASEPLISVAGSGSAFVAVYKTEQTGTPK